MRVRQGTEVTARVLPWLRAREVWLHAVDLDAGAGLAGAPEELLDELVADVVGGLSRAEGCPVLELRAADRPGTWRLGAPDDEDVARPAVEGEVADLVLWLAGRSDGSALTAPRPLPALPAWL